MSANASMDSTDGSGVDTGRLAETKLSIVAVEVGPSVSIEAVTTYGLGH